MFVCVYVDMKAGALGSQQRMLDTLELELGTTTRALETEFMSSGRAVGTFNH